MKIKDLFEKWHITGLKLKAGFVEMDWQPDSVAQQAAWELYIEMITRISTQPLEEDAGDELTALTSVYNLFEITRKLLKRDGRKSLTFSKIAIVVLNQKIRPFTAYWHGRSTKGELNDPGVRQQFRKALSDLQPVLRGYAGILADIAEVEEFHDDNAFPLTEL